MLPPHSYNPSFGPKEIGKKEAPLQSGYFFFAALLRFSGLLFLLSIELRKNASGA